MVRGMAKRKYQPPRTGGHLWGRRRVEAGVTLSALSAECGVNKGVLSLMENGRVIPTSQEYDAIIDALARLTPSEGELRELYGR